MSSKIIAAIDRIIEIDAQKESLTEERKKLAALIEGYALPMDTIPLVDEEREGRKVMLDGSKMRLPVIFESDMIMGSFKVDSVQHLALKLALGTEYPEVFPKLWKPTNSLECVPKDGLKYRQTCRELLPPEIAASVIHGSLSRDKHGIPKSRTVIATDQATPL